MSFRLGASSAYPSPGVDRNTVPRAEARAAAAAPESACAGSPNPPPSKGSENGAGPGAVVLPGSMPGIMLPSGAGMEEG